MPHEDSRLSSSAWDLRDSNTDFYPAEILDKGHHVEHSDLSDG